MRRTGNPAAPVTGRGPRRGRPRAAIAAAVAAALLLAILRPAWAGEGERRFPGDQWPAEYWQLADAPACDLFRDKEVQLALYPLRFMLDAIAVGSAVAWAGSALGSALGNAVIEKTAKRLAEKYIVVPGTAAAAGGTYIDPSNSRALIWMNWPPDSYSFDSAPMKTGLVSFVSDMSANVWAAFLNFLANQALFASKFFVMLANNIAVLAFDSEWVSAAADWLGEVAAKASPFAGEGAPLKAAFLIALALLGAAVAWRVLRGDLIGTAKVLLVAALSVAGTLIYAANAAPIIRSAAGFTDALAGAGLSATALLLPEGARRESSLETGIAAATNAAWAAVIAAPWSWGQFGTADPNALVLTDQEWEALSPHLPDGGTAEAARDPAAAARRIAEEFQELPGAGAPVSRGLLSGRPPSGIGRYLSKQDLEAMKREGKLYADHLYLALAQCDYDKRNALLEALSDPGLDHGRHPGTVYTCAPGAASAWKHLTAAFATLPPAVAYLILAVCLGVPILFAQFALMLALALAPLGLLIGVAGDAGRAGMLAYLRATAGFFLAKALYGFYFGAVLFLATALSQALLF